MRELNDFITPEIIGKPGIIIVVDEDIFQEMNRREFEAYAASINPQFDLFETTLTHPRHAAAVAELVWNRVCDGYTEAVWVNDPTMMLALEVQIRKNNLFGATHIYLIGKDRQNAGTHATDSIQHIPFESLWRIYVSFAAPFTELKIERGKYLEEGEE